MNSEDIPPWAEHSSPPPPPTGIWKKRLRTSQRAWPTVEEIAHLAASLAHAFPEAKPDALAEKAWELWIAARELMEGINKDPLGELEARRFRDIELSETPPPTIPEPKDYPVEFDEALLFIVGAKARKEKRPERFRAYLTECDPDGRKLFRRLKRTGFHIRSFRRHFLGFKAWREKNLELMHKDKSTNAAKARWARTKSKGDAHRSGGKARHSKYIKKSG